MKIGKYFFYNIIQAEPGETLDGDTNPKNFRDLMLGADGNETLTGLLKSDILKGFAGNDTLRGDYNLLSITMDEKYKHQKIDDFGNDLLFGGDGIDLLLGDAQEISNTISGAKNSLKYKFGNDFLSGGHDDTANVLYGEAVVIATIVEGYKNNYHAQYGHDLLTVSTTITDTSKNTFVGDTFSETLIISGNLNKIKVAYGNDKFFGSPSDDFITGDVSNVAISFDDANQGKIKVNFGDDFIYAKGGDDIIFGDGENTFFSLTEATNSTLIMKQGNDKIYAGDGDDVILPDHFIGGEQIITGVLLAISIPGNDYIDVGEGIDTVILPANPVTGRGVGFDTIVNLAPGDSLDFDGPSIADLDSIVTVEDLGENNDVIIQFGDPMDPTDAITLVGIGTSDQSLISMQALDDAGYNIV